MPIASMTTGLPSTTSWPSDGRRTMASGAEASSTTSTVCSTPVVWFSRSRATARITSFVGCAGSRFTSPGGSHTRPWNSLSRETSLNGTGSLPAASRSAGSSARGRLPGEPSAGSASMGRAWERDTVSADWPLTKNSTRSTPVSSPATAESTIEMLPSVSVIPGVGVAMAMAGARGARGSTRTRTVWETFFVSVTVTRSSAGAPPALRSGVKDTVRLRLLASVPGVSDASSTSSYQASTFDSPTSSSACNFTECTTPSSTRT
ncbi:hypothetical protein COSO111634_23410 [Corallococcus soli]